MSQRRYVKTFESFINEAQAPTTFVIEVDTVEYTVTRLPSGGYYKKDPEFEMKNMFGMEGADPTEGAYGHYEGVWMLAVTADTLTYQLFKKWVDREWGGDEEEALMDAVRITGQYYDSVGWEFLSDASKM